MTNARYSCRGYITAFRNWLAWWEFNFNIFVYEKEMKLLNVFTYHTYFSWRYASRKNLLDINI